MARSARCFYSLPLPENLLYSFYIFNQQLFQRFINKILIGDIAWNTKLKMLRWKTSLRFVRRVDTKMVFTLCLKRRAIPPNGFLSAHPVTMFLIQVSLFNLFFYTNKPVSLLSALFVGLILGLSIPFIDILNNIDYILQLFG